MLRVPDPYTSREINPLIGKREKGKGEGNGVHSTQAAKRCLIGWDLGVGQLHVIIDIGSTTQTRTCREDYHLRLATAALDLVFDWTRPCIEIVTSFASGEGGSSSILNNITLPMDKPVL